MSLENRLRLVSCVICRELCSGLPETWHLVSCATSEPEKNTHELNLRIATDRLNSFWHMFQYMPKMQCNVHSCKSLGNAKKPLKYIRERFLWGLCFSCVACRELCFGLPEIWYLVSCASTWKWTWENTHELNLKIATDRLNSFWHVFQYMPKMQWNVHSYKSLGNARTLKRYPWKVPLGIVLFIYHVFTREAQVGYFDNF